MRRRTLGDIEELIAMRRWGIGALMVFAVLAAAAPAPLRAQTPDRPAMLAEAMRSVVSIKIAPPETLPNPLSPLFDDPDRPASKPSRDVLDLDALLRRAAATREKPMASGTGFVIDAARGLIVTADYVVAEGEVILIQRPDGQETPATVIGRDEITRIAVLKADVGGAPALRWADDPPVTGADAFIIANAFGLGLTAASGMVGGVSTAYDGEPLLLLDAPIYKGAAGGPVLDARGAVMGVAIAEFGVATSSMRNLGLAVPASVAAATARALIAEGRIVRAFIGAELSGPDVIAVTPGSPAAVAGLRVGDSVLEIDGAPRSDIPRYVRSRPIGATLTFKVNRIERRKPEVLTLSITTGGR